MLRGAPVRRILVLQPGLLLAGVGAWAFGVSQIQRQAIGPYGVLASANAWFFLGLAALVVGMVAELSRTRPRTWLLGAFLVALIVAIHTTVPLLYGGTPEYAWVYKHVGVAQAFGQYHRVTDTSNIYQEWPALFTTVAAISSLGNAGPLTFAAWGPVAFELADALLLLGIFRLLTADRRLPYLAVLLYEGLIAWVGQDYLSPQAFGYLLWLGIMAIVIRWLLVPAPAHCRWRFVNTTRGFLLRGWPTPADASPAMRWIAVALVAVIYFAIVAAHQLTPYIALLGIAALVVLGLVWRGWLAFLLLAVIAVGFLVPHYGLISSQFGGVFSGGNVFENAAGSQGILHKAAEANTGRVVHGLAACMWLGAVAAIALRWRSLGRVALPAVLAFSPFVVLGAQSYGGEAIYRVFLFSAPWCALLIAELIAELRGALRSLVSVVVCTAALVAGLQGLYGPTAVYAFTPRGAGREPVAVRTRTAGLAADPPGGQLPRARGRQLRGLRPPGDARRPAERGVVARRGQPGRGDAVDRLARPFQRVRRVQQEHGQLRQLFRLSDRLRAAREGRRRRTRPGRSCTATPMS